MRSLGIIFTSPASCLGASGIKTVLNFSPCSTRKAKFHESSSLIKIGTNCLSDFSPIAPAVIDFINAYPGKLINKLTSNFLSIFSPNWNETKDHLKNILRSTKR